MDADQWIIPPPTERLTGSEVITGAGATVQDFWSWAMSNFRSNIVRSMFAEFLVARAVGGANRLRVEWDPYDVLSESEVKIEVKTSAYMQAWDQRRPSAVQFGRLRGRTWTSTDGYGENASYNADVYVFAVLSGSDHDSYRPTDTAQWQFWALPVAVLRRLNQKSMTLSTVERLAGPPVKYTELAVRIEHLAHPDGQPYPIIPVPGATHSG